MTYNTDFKNDPTPEDFFNGDEIKTAIFKKKYMPKGTNLGVRSCFERVGSAVSSVSIEQNKSYWTERWTQEMMEDVWRPGGSILASTNEPNKKISVFNCTTIAIPDDSLESIYEARYKAAKVAAYRQGLGLDFSNLRPRGMKINNSAEVSEGAVHWMASFDRVGEEVGQRGRIPAILGSLKVTHPDILEFIVSKDDGEKLNNMNISVQITENFMHAVVADLEWTMSFLSSSGEKLEKKVQAREIFETICQHAWKTGEPGVQFIDRMKRFSIQEALGENIISTNACSEKPLCADSVCCLASINIGKLPKISAPNFEENVKTVMESLVRFMDNVVQYEIENSFKSPIDSQLEMVKRLREIGIGVTNVHRWLYDQGFQYDSNEAIAAMEKLFERLFYHGFIASVDLAKERGPCPAWSLTKEKNLLESEMTPFLIDVFSEFPELETLYLEHGIRNAAILSIAPTGSLSMTFGEDVLSSGIEPLISWYYWRKTRALSDGSYEYFFVLPQVIKDIVLQKMSEKDMSSEEMNEYDVIFNFPTSMKDPNGLIGEKIINTIKKYVDVDLLRGAMDIDPFKKVQMMGRIQRWVDAAISVTYNVQKEFSVDEVKKLYMQAYNCGLKSITVYREGSREGILLTEFPKNQKVELDDFGIVRPNNVVYNYAPKRPEKLIAEIHHVMKHKIIVGLLDGKPYEVFIVETEDKLPKNGFIVKRSKRRYMLLDETNKETINLIDKEVINDEIKAITRLVSSNLRHGVPIDFICDQLKKCGDIINAYPKMLGRALDKYKMLSIKERKVEGEKCPECDSQMIEYDGCVKCIVCEHSKCG